LKSVRFYLVLLVFTLVAPGTVFTGYLVERLAEEQRGRTIAHSMQAARDVAADLEREVQGLIRVTETIRLLPPLARGNLEAFQTAATDVARQFGVNVLLTSPDGRQLINTRLPYGAKLPEHSALYDTPFRPAPDSAGPQVSGLFRGMVAGKLVFNITLRVVYPGQPERLLHVSVEPRRLTDALAQQHLPEPWILVVADTAGTILARWPERAGFVGSFVSAAWRQHALGAEGSWLSQSRDGMPVRTTYVRMKSTGWVVAIALPRQVLDGPANRLLGTVGAFGAVTLAAGLLLAFAIAGRLSRAIARLELAGAALAQAEKVPALATGISEVDRVGQVLENASRTQREQAAALRESEARLSLAQRIGGIGSFDRDLRTDKTVVSETFAALMGIPGGAQVVQYSDTLALVHPDDRPAVRNAINAALRHGDGYQISYRLVRADDRRVRTITARAGITRDRTGEPYRVVGAVQDVTEWQETQAKLQTLNDALEVRVQERTAALEAEGARRAEMEARLRQAQKMEALGQLTGGIAHDFNNLLTVIIGNLDAMMPPVVAKEDRDARLRRHIEMALEGARRAAQLTHRLLAFGRRQPLAPRTVDVNRLVAGVSDILRRTLGATIAVEIVYEPALWPVFADANQLENALLNLTLNARDAMSSGGRLTIETANVSLDDPGAPEQADMAAGEYVLLSVSDSGCGMPPEVLERAFEPFFTTKESGKGSGLGLSMVYGFVHQSGGHARIYSEPGEGTTIKLYLPRAADAAAGSSGGGAADGTGAGDILPRAHPGETVLLVEDNEAVRRYAAEALSGLGYTVLEAGTGSEALDVAKRTAGQRLDLLFTDVVLPGGTNGRMLAESIARLRPDIPVLFTTGYTPNAIVHQGRLDAGVLLLSKPYRLADLARRVREAIEGRSHNPAEI
jgi:signal transduction histidine kinase/ActR/RegA family two-component response regulator